MHSMQVLFVSCFSQSAMHPFYTFFFMVWTQGLTLARQALWHDALHQPSCIHFYYCWTSRLFSVFSEYLWKILGVTHSLYISEYFLIENMNRNVWVWWTLSLPHSLGELLSYCSPQRIRILLTSGHKVEERSDKGNDRVVRVPWGHAIE
jgi:hypothetical protein